MVKKEFVIIRMSDIPDDTELEIVLVKPGEHIQHAIPHRTTGKKTVYLYYKAYFTHDKRKRIFNIVFPKNKFTNALISGVPMEQRNDPNRAVKFKFQKTRRGVISIRNHHYI